MQEILSQEKVFSHFRKLLQILSVGLTLILKNSLGWIPLHQFLKFLEYSKPPETICEGDKGHREYVKLLSLNFAFRLVGIGACIFTHGVRTSLHGSAQHKAADGRGRTLFVWSRIIVADDCKFARYQSVRRSLPPTRYDNLSLTQFSSLWHRSSPALPALSTLQAVSPVVGIFDFNLTGHNTLLSRRPLAQEHDHVVHLARL